MRPADSRTKLEQIDGLLAALRNAPRDANVWSHVADVLMETGQFEKAVLAFDLALQFDRTLHRAQIGLTVALDLCGRDMARRPPALLRPILWDALQSMETLVQGLREEKRSPFVDVHAIRLQRETERRVAANPYDADALFLKSAFLAKQGRFEDAVACVDKLRQRNGNYPGAVEFRRQLKDMMKLAAPSTARPRKRAGVPRS